MLNDDNYRWVQVIDLLAKWMVLWTFGWGIIAYQLKHKHYPKWPMPGAYVGAAFLLVDGLLPLHMAFNRAGLLPWDIYSIPATILFTFIAINSILALWRWWFRGFDDTPGPWQGRILETLPAKHD